MGHLQEEAKKYNETMSEYNRKIEDDYIYSNGEYIPIIEKSTIVVNDKYDYYQKSKTELIAELEERKRYIRKFEGYQSMTQALIDQDNPNTIQIIWKILKMTPQLIKLTLAIITILSYFKGLKK